MNTRREVWLPMNSGAEATAVQTLRDYRKLSELREASGLRRVYRRLFVERT